MVNMDSYRELKGFCSTQGCILIAVSKLKKEEDIMTLYNEGHRDFGENYVQEFLGKYEALPRDINWHYIGHLQRNKVKMLTGKTHLIHGVDSEKLLIEIDKEAGKAALVTRVLLQLHLSGEESKFGMDERELYEVMNKITSGTFPHVKVCGLMGMASFSSDQEVLTKEFSFLKSQFDLYRSDEFKFMSAGMSGDYELATRLGSNMIRIGSSLFGSRQ